MKKWSIVLIAAALAFTVESGRAQTKNKSVPSQKGLKTNTSKQAEPQIHTDQGVPFNPKGAYGAGKTSASTGSGQSGAIQNAGSQKTKATMKKKSGSSSSNKKKTVNNPGIDSNNGH
jgi:hypothetical protein